MDLFGRHDCVSLFTCQAFFFNNINYGNKAKRKTYRSFHFPLLLSFLPHPSLSPSAPPPPPPFLPDTHTLFSFSHGTPSLYSQYAILFSSNTSQLRPFNVTLNSFCVRAHAQTYWTLRNIELFTPHIPFRIPLRRLSKQGTSRNAMLHRFQHLRPYLFYFIM